MTEQGTNIVTWICCIIIGAAFFIFFYITKNAKEDFLQKHKRTVDAFPSIVSTLGVFGTFLGITIGLAGFNVNDLTHNSSWWFEDSLLYFPVRNGRFSFASPLLHRY